MNTRQTSRLRRLAAITAGLVAASMMLSGCLYSMIPEGAQPRPSVTNTPDTEGVPAELLPFYEQTLEWAACDRGGATFDCTYVTAPLDWENPGDGEIPVVGRAPSGQWYAGRIAADEPGRAGGPAAGTSSSTA